MASFLGNVALSTLVASMVVLPGSAMQARRFRNGTQAPRKSQELSCDSAPNLESLLDSLSWKLYEGAHLDLDGGNLSMRDTAPSQLKDLSSEAYARINRFVKAVDKYHMPVGTAAGTVKVNNSKSMSKAAINATVESAYCCHHVSEDDAYWQETEQWHITNPGYIKCQYSDGCNRKVTNGMRVKSIRRALHGAQQLFHNLNVQSMLYGGSAIGQYRCGDVIPWDVDCDILVGQAHIDLIHKKVFNKEMDFDNWVKGETSVDLAHLGAPGIVLVKKNPCAPFEIVDTKEGFFCDVFTAKWQTSELYTPWWSAPHTCGGMFEGCDKAGGGQRCYKFAQNTVYPTASCTMSGSAQNCAPDMPSYLRTLYGNGWHTPNRTLKSL